MTASPPAPLTDNPAPAPGIIPDGPALAAAIVIADIVHELRRAHAGPIFRVYRGPVAAAHAGGIAFGWLAPQRVTYTAQAPRIASVPLLALTEAGRAALSASGRA